MIEKLGSKKRWIWVALVAVVVAGALLVVFGRFSADDANAADEVETATVIVGDLSASASAGGNVTAARQANLAPSQPGIVDVVLVRVGDQVAAGDALVQLAADDLALAVANAEQTLRIQEANLATLVNPATDADIAAAEAQLASAESNLQDVLDGPSELELAAQEANVRAAEAGVSRAVGNLQSAQDAVSDAQIASARAQLEAAKLARTQARIANEANPTGETDRARRDAEEQVTIAQARLDELLAGPSVGAAQADVAASAAQRDAAQANFEEFASGSSASAVASAEAQVAQAQAALDALVSGPDEADVRSAEAQVAQAQLALDGARDALENATLRAPFDGIITSVNVAPGEFASGAAVTLVGADSLQLVLAVDEVDIGSLSVGQPALVTLETWPTVEIETVIETIAPSAAGNGTGLVTYDVYLNLSETDLPIRVGMTANANLITANREDVLLLESRAINIDRQNGTFSVNLLEEDGTTRELSVTVGLRDGRYTQITSGLQEGDEVIIGEAPVLTFGPGGPNNE